MAADVYTQFFESTSQIRQNGIYFSRDLLSTNLLFMRSTFSERFAGHRWDLILTRSTYNERWVIDEVYFHREVRCKCI